MPPCAEYDISEPETIDVELPGAALVSAADARLTPAFPAYALIVRAEGGSAGLDGTLLKDANVATVQSPVVSSLTVTLRGVEFSEDVVRAVVLMFFVLCFLVLCFLQRALILRRIGLFHVYLF